MPAPPFSSRLRWDLTPNRLSRLIEQKRSAGVSILDLTESNPTAAGFDYPAEAILSALGDARSLRYEPSAAGLASARAAVSGYYATALGQEVDPDRILLTASTSEAYALVFKLLADPGDEVLVPAPSYPLFDYLAALESVRLVQYPLIYSRRWTIDFDALARSITPRSRAIVLVNPNNPTGSYLKESELAPLVALAQEHSLALISDEVFADYLLNDQTPLVQSLSGVGEVLTFCLSGLSKVAALPQLKLGWIVTGGPSRERGAAFERLELIADTYLSVSAPVQWAAPALLDGRAQLQRQILDRVERNRAWIATRIGGTSSWRLLATEGGWYAVLEAPRILSEEEWVLSLLERENMLVQPGFFFDFEREAFLVVSLLTKEKVFQGGIARLLARA
ncbi:MAG TPA: pyridoxal phosphate-dependent aminotransferase [Bryobacteraceae bacterium]|nr:pyridoxal phosphate-dependent aminotransferase [Bryobacteraceae bacterium]